MHVDERSEGLLPEQQAKTYDDFYNSARYNKILDQKTTILIHMATAMALGCYP